MPKSSSPGKTKARQPLNNARRSASLTRPKNVIFGPAIACWQTRHSSSPTLSCVCWMIRRWGEYSALPGGDWRVRSTTGKRSFPDLKRSIGVEGGRWKVEGGRWKVEGGRWKVERSTLLSGRPQAYRSESMRGLRNVMYRTHRCLRCGLVINHYRNAARNILHRGLYVLRSKRNTEQAWGNTRQSPILRGWAPLQATF